MVDKPESDLQNVYTRGTWCTVTLFFSANSTHLKEASMNTNGTSQEGAENESQLISVPNTTATNKDVFSSTTSSSPIPHSTDLTEDNDASFDMLGPIVLNSDGTMSRISNWQEMTEKEKDSAKKLISKRNKSRKKALSELEGGE